MPKPERFRTRYRMVLRDSDFVASPDAQALHGQVSNYTLSPLLERVLEMDAGDTLPAREGVGQFDNIDLTIEARARIPVLYRSFTGEVEVDIFDSDLLSTRQPNGAVQSDRMHWDIVGHLRVIDPGQVNISPTSEHADTFTVHVSELTLNRRAHGSGTDEQILHIAPEYVVEIGNVDILAAVRTALGL